MKYKYRRMALVITGLFSCFIFSTSAVNIYEQFNHKNFRQSKLFHQSIDFDNIDYKLLNASIHFVTNEQRVAKKKNILSHHPALEATAKMHAVSMLTYSFLAHINNFENRKRNPDMRAILNQITNPYLAENIARVFGLQYDAGKKIYVIGEQKFSYKPVEAKAIEAHTYISFADNVVKGWMNSKGHRKNILSDDAVALGCATVFYYDKSFVNFPTFICVQNFQFFEAIVVEQ